MKEMLKESLFITGWIIFVVVVGMGLYFLVELIAGIGSIILAILASVVGLFIFVFLLLSISRFIERFY